MKKITLFVFFVLCAIGMNAQSNGLNGNGYYRIRNLATGKYIRVYGNVFDATQSADFAKIFETEPAIQMVDAETAMTDPGTVFLIEGNGTKVMTDANLLAQTTGLLKNSNYYDMMDVLNDFGIESTSPAVTLERLRDSNGYLLIDENGNQLYRATTFKNLGNAVADSEIAPSVARHFGVTVEQLRSCEELYFVDNNGSFTIDYRRSQASKPIAQWIIEPVNETYVEQFYYGVKPNALMTDSEHSGKYYTTHYTEFPYTLKDGIKAYYVDGIEEADGEFTAVMKEITGTVPALTPVILECKGTDPATNRLVPVYDKENSIAPLSHNLLKGVIDLNNDLSIRDGSIADTDRTKYDANTMMVFSIAQVNNEGGELDPSSPSYMKLGFYTMFGVTYLASNKAYLDITDYPQVLEQGGNVKSMKMRFVPSEGESTGVQSIIQPSDAGVYYNLSGQRVASPVKGLYIVNGKKVYIK